MYEHSEHVTLGRTAEGQEVVGLARVSRIRLMRGQVVVRELAPEPSAVLWTPEQGPRQVKTHRGVVLGLGPPARLTEHPSSPEVPHGFEVGDVVQFHFGAVGTQQARTRPWVDGKPATWLAQPEVDGVWVPEDLRDRAELWTPDAHPCAHGTPEDDAPLSGDDWICGFCGAYVDHERAA